MKLGSGVPGWKPRPWVRGSGRGDAGVWGQRGGLIFGDKRSVALSTEGPWGLGPVSSPCGAPALVRGLSSPQALTEPWPGRPLGQSGSLPRLCWSLRALTAWLGALTVQGPGGWRAQVEPGLVHGGKPRGAEVCGLQVRGQPPRPCPTRPLHSHPASHLWPHLTRFS